MDVFKNAAIHEVRKLYHIIVCRVLRNIKIFKNLAIKIHETEDVFKNAAIHVVRKFYHIIVCCVLRNIKVFHNLDIKIHETRGCF